MTIIIIFMLIIAIISEHYIMPFNPLFENIKMNFPLHYGNMWTSFVRHKWIQQNLWWNFCGGLRYAIQNPAKKWCSYKEFTWVDVFGSVLKMTLGLFFYCGAKNYRHYFKVYHTTLWKKFTDFSLLPPPLSFSLFFFFSHFSSLSSFYTCHSLSHSSDDQLRDKKGKKKQKEKKNKKKKQTNRALHWACPSVWPLLCFVFISFFNLSNCIPYHNTCWYCFI